MSVMSLVHVLDLPLFHFTKCFSLLCQEQMELYQPSGSRGSMQTKLDHELKLRSDCGFGLRLLEVFQVLPLAY